MMASNRKVMVLPGDGIGNEVMHANMKIIDWLAKNRSLDFDISEGLVGGASYDAHGTPLTDEVLADCVGADAVLFGAVGGPQYDDLPFELKPERGLLTLRKEMDLFANLRPAIVFPALVEASTLKPEVVSGLDIMILRELCGGSYLPNHVASMILVTASRKAMTPMPTQRRRFSGLAGLVSILRASVMAV
jgi:3-isopropylmalate dehydrogenase